MADQQKATPLIESPDYEERRRRINGKQFKFVRETVVWLGKKATWVYCYEYEEWYSTWQRRHEFRGDYR